MKYKCDNKSCGVVLNSWSEISGTDCPMPGCDGKLEKQVEEEDDMFDFTEEDWDEDWPEDDVNYDYSIPPEPGIDDWDDE